MLIFILFKLYFYFKYISCKNYINKLIISLIMQKKGLVRRLFFFILFLIGIFFLVLLIKYNWDFNRVVEYVTGLAW